MKKAPFRTIGGSATTDHQFAYFTTQGFASVYRYEWHTEKWEELPPSPYGNPGLVVIDGALIAIGGNNESCYTNKQFMLQQDKWVEHYPPMNTLRSDTTTVSTSDGNYFVIGGYGCDGARTAKVELFHTKYKRWYELTNLPHALAFPTATICGNHLHVIGVDGDGYSCSLYDFSSDQTHLMHPIWTPLPRQPVTWSTVATLCGQLVLIGGQQSGLSINSILQLVDEEWVQVGSMSSCRNWCLVATPSPDKIMIVGGDGGGDSVEKCVVI